MKPLSKIVVTTAQFGLGAVQILSIDTMKVVLP